MLINPAAYGQALPAGCAVGAVDLWRHYTQPGAAGVINAQLARMYASGQRKIAIVIWHGAADTTTGDAATSGFANYDQLCITAQTSGGSLSAADLASLRAFTYAIAAQGFNEIQIRFAPTSDSNPQWWSTWKSGQFNSNWSVIQNVRAAVYQTLRGSNVALYFDLGLELGGLWNLPASWNAPYPNPPLIKTYVQTMMTNYYGSFGRADTIGVSISASGPTVEGYLQLAQSIGMPARIGLDIYGDQSQGNHDALVQSFNSTLADIVGALQTYGATSIAYVQETYFNSNEVGTALANAFRASGFSPITIMQWPLSFGAAGAINVADVSSFGNYLMPQGFFLTADTQTIYFSNGLGHACAYQAWSAFLAAGGRADLANVQKTATYPAGLISDGVCQP